jgi:dihydrofolate synthase/folylpolyglutamate synthase
VWQLFDVAHNPQSIRSLAERISENAHQQPTYAVFSMLKDKALAESIAPITPFIDEWFIAGLPGERGMTTLELKEAMQQQVTCPVHAYTDIRSAHEAACLAAKKENARVVIFGSFHTVAEAYSKQGK